MLACVRFANFVFPIPMKREVKTADQTKNLKLAFKSLFKSIFSWQM